jgi:low affinity Fe/Cu permease
MFGALSARAEECLNMQKWFGEAANAVSRWTGSSWAFILAFTIIIVWAISGPIFGFSDTWQLVINTGTTIVTFLMVFLIQNTQNRDQRALQLKLDELLRAVQGAREAQFAGIEEKPEQALEEAKEELRAECGLCATPEEHQRNPQHLPQAPAKAA